MIVRVTLKVLPWEIPGDVRLRMALKTLLRRFGLKNLGIEDVPDSVGQAQTAQIDPDPSEGRLARHKRNQTA
jgi:hypothetical protein